MRVRTQCSLRRVCGFLFLFQLLCFYHPFDEYVSGLKAPNKKRTKFFFIKKLCTYVVICFSSLALLQTHYTQKGRVCMSKMKKKIYFYSFFLYSMEKNMKWIKKNICRHIASIKRSKNFLHAGNCRLFCVCFSHTHNKVEWTER